MTAAALLVLLALIGACTSSDGDDAGPTTTSASTSAGVETTDTAPADAAPTFELTPVHAQAAERPFFQDGLGREVLLRGVNVIGLGDYYQADPTLDATLPVTDEDWAEMATLGFSAVRLILSWSLLEPTRGSLDEAYVDRIRGTVEIAAAHGIYVILDMHQDAWGTSIATPAGVTCPEGTETAIGWDGAPAWATLTDDADTCRLPGQREASQAVHTAFESFYADRDGIRTALAQTWGRLAGEFADDPTVAGYDLFNEPNAVGDIAQNQVGYTQFVLDSIAQIRAAETAAGGFDHVVFVEPIVVFPIGDTVPTAGFTSDTNVAFAPHNYWGSIVYGIDVATGFRFATQAAATLGMPYWIGEYGWWDTSDESLAELADYAVAEDTGLVGGAWWQWRQACGDPHSIGVAGNVPDDQIHLHGQGCPDQTDLGVTEEFAVVLSRAYPRAAPGQLLSLVSDPAARTMTVRGQAGPSADDAPLVVWVPGEAEPVVSGTNIADVDITAVDGGFLVRAAAGCAYSLSIDDGAESGVSGDPTAC
ncbi:cellulase family glycosylhydrolase [soil metagenome]